MSTAKRLLRLALIGASLTILCGITASAKTLGTGDVTTDSLRLRSQPSTNSTILATYDTGKWVLVTEDVNDEWYKVYTDETVGYMAKKYVTLNTLVTAPLGYGKVDTNGDVLNLRAANSTDAEIFTTISDGTRLTLDGIVDGWFLVTYDGHTGYVSSAFIDLCGEEDTTTSNGVNTSTQGQSVGQQLANLAQTFVGSPYVYGATGPNSFDCSGFMYYLYRQFGYTINRGSTSQYKNDGVSVNKADLLPGDLVFFRYNTTAATSHVGMYIGNGQFIHASTTGYQVRISDLTTGHYNTYYVGARRIVT